MIIHKKLALIIMVGTALFWSIPTRPFFSVFMNSDIIRTAPARFISMTSRVFSSVRNFLVPARIVTAAKSRMHTVKIKTSHFSEKAANFASTAVDKVGGVYDDAKNRAQVTKASLVAKVDKVKKQARQPGFWERLSLSRFFGDEIQLI